MADKRLFVYKNEAGSEGKVVNVKPKDSMGRFMKMASKNSMTMKTIICWAMKPLQMK